MPWFHAVAEHDHALQNPTSPQKILRLGELMRLDSSSRVLDVACGRGGPALVLAEAFGCTVVGVERAPEFVQVARDRVAQAGLTGRVQVLEEDARRFPLEPESFDAALCLGASFIWEGLRPTVAALSPAVRRGGRLAVGEPFWRSWPLASPAADEGFTGLSETVDRFESDELRLVGLIASSEDDWDEYESLHWRALEEWLGANERDPDAADIRRQHVDARHRYLNSGRERLGWAIFVGWKLGGSP
jgi:SAM-dependent methyltransferase